MDSTMQDVDLLVSDLFLHGLRTHPNSRVFHYHGDAATWQTFSEVGDSVHRLASALRDLGVREDDVVATLCWNTPAHLAAYFAIPGMGAILHTLNLRLHDDQIAFIANHAGDKVVLVDADLAPQLARIIERLETVEHVVVIGDASLDVPDRMQLHRYDALLTAASPTFEWPRKTEREAAALCYTTGTTGDPKGVAYSHRSIYLHSLQISSGSAFAFTDADIVMPVVPMFHANAWGWPHACWLNGSDLVMTDRFLQPEHLCHLITDLQVTAAAAVPTLWTGIGAHASSRHGDLTSLRLAVSGGSPLSVALVRSFYDEHGVRLTQGWGMTETSPLLTFSRPSPDTAEEQIAHWSSLTGRIVPGVRARIVDEAGRELPQDGSAVGEIELRGSTVTASYFRTDASDKFHDGWLRTGDLGAIHPGGWVQIKDRLKDGIKSGGEWISTVELENALLEHPAVAEVAVVGVPDDRWEERPLACVTVAAGATVTADELREFLGDKVAKWWLPERWTFLDQIPKTSVGKLDKRRLRTDYDDNLFEVRQPSTTPTIS